MNEIIVVKKHISNKIFLDYFTYQNPLLSVKDLIGTKEDKNEKLVNNINDGQIDLKNNINRKEIPENENLKKVADTVEKIFGFNKQQKGKGGPSDLTRRGKVFDSKCIEFLTPKQTIQSLPIAIT